MTETILAGVGLAICLLLITRLLLPRPQRSRFDSIARRAWFAIRLKALLAWNWRRNRLEAEQAARDAIDRASAQAARRKDDGVWKGNVYESKSFRKPRKPH